jgi:hypothetical protein
MACFVNVLEACICAAEAIASNISSSSYQSVTLNDTEKLSQGINYTAK